MLSKRLFDRLYALISTLMLARRAVMVRLAWLLRPFDSQGEALTLTTLSTGKVPRSP